MSFPKMKLGECAEIHSGSTPRTNNPDFWDGDITWVTPKDLSKLKSKFISKTESKITQLGFDSCSTKLLPENSVLFSSRAPIGHVAINTIPMCTNQGFKSFVPKADLLDSQYLYYWLKANKEYLQDLGVGATFKEISKTVIANVEIPLPPLAEQRRIASILDQADELRQKRQQAIEKLDQLLQATFIDMFGDPVSNPKGWELVSAKNVLKIQGGYAFSSTDFSKSGIPVVKIGNANKLGFSTEKFDFIIPQYPEKLKQYELRSGDLLMSLTGTVGKDDYGNITEVTDDYELYYLNQRVAKLEVINTLFSKNYIRYFFSQSSIKALITKNNRGVRQANISNSDLYELDIPLPTKAQLDKFDSFIESINEMKRYSKIQLISSNKLFIALQNQAFNGTL
ncbi:restriction endonuclease subunit S [Acinetobacter baumannii]|nr:MULTISPECIES: restriction endonuclease subunit S [Acinetobacter calcoaceticus/baumannii complex]MDC4767911.1 restriction endonuclease subunit S [Acinetobacter baumannii]MDC5056384.1 restriction endonuclease subunit S [Acinetobacter baumannii]MDO7385288.1 restriction endonuclease subunit S [Acinetobacter baumannii]QCA00612.1 restriction endonuclease subunit S [Acinetobacter nosocomialis]WVH57846.1 restriction endonuclease subunit S [Acinetobacter pittii]